MLCIRIPDWIGFKDLFPVWLSLGSCNISTLPAPIFEKFLEAHPKNELDVDHNLLFFCDSRLKWLKHGERGFVHRVRGTCANDPWNTIFTSPLIE